MRENNCTRAGLVWYLEGQRQPASAKTAVQQDGQSVCTTKKPMSPPYPPVVRCPPLLLLSQLFWALSSSCSILVVLALAAAASLSPVVLPILVLLIFLSSLLLPLLFSSWRAPLILSCCPFGVVWSQLVLLLPTWCVRVAFLPSSSCPPLVFLLLLLSGCLRCFPRQWLGLWPPTTTKLFGVYAVYAGIFLYRIRSRALTKK